MKKYAKLLAMTLVFGMTICTNQAMAGNGSGDQTRDQIKDDSCLDTNYSTELLIIAGNGKGPGDGTGDGICDIPFAPELDIIAGNGKGPGDGTGDGICDIPFAPELDIIAGNGKGSGDQTRDQIKDDSCTLEG